MSFTVLATEEGKRLLRKAQKLRKDQQLDREKGVKWTYAGIAAAVHVEEKTVNRFFNGKEKINFDTAKDICDLLGLPIEDVVDPQDLPSSVKEKTLIDWHPVCHQVLAEQQEQQRIRRKITERGFELNIFVPLGLVERREQQRRSGEVARDKIDQLEQEVITKEYQHDAFLKEVISGNSDKNKHIAIIGEPGAGKSTLLDKIASWIRDNDRGLPICIALGSLQGKTLTDYLLENWLEEALNYIDAEQRKDINAVRESLKELFRTQQVWLLLDGLDEMAVSTNAVSTIREHLQGWVGKARVILTSRLNVWDARVNNPLSNFDTYKTLDFTDEQVEEFIDGWFGEAEKIDPPNPLKKGASEFKVSSTLNKETSKPQIPPIKTQSPPYQGGFRGIKFATQLKTKIKESRYQNLQRLIKNPLRLSLLCQTWYHQQGDLPETKAELYQRFVREINEEWKPEQYSLNWTKQQQVNQALGNLALRGIDSEARFRLPESLVNKEMGEELFSLAKKIGWLNLVDREFQTGEPVYAFYHPTFQEYFAAIVIDYRDYFLPREHIDRPVLGKKYRIFESEWKEVILFWFGREDIDKKEKEKFINALTDFKDGCGDWTDVERIDKGFYEYRAYFLAAAGISEFKEYSRTKEIVEQIVEWKFGNLISDIKTSAETAISETNRIETIAALIKLINFTTARSNCLQAIEYLGKIGVGNQQAIKCLVKLITSGNYEYESILLKAIKSLAAIDPKNELAISALVQLINSTSNEFIFWDAAKIIIAIDPNKLPNQITTIIRLIYEDFSNISKYLIILEKLFHNNETEYTISIDFIYHINNGHDLRIAMIILEQFILSNRNINRDVIVTALTNLIENSNNQNIIILAKEIQENILESYSR